MLKTPDWLALLPLFREYEFTTLMKLMPSIESTERQYEAITSRDRLEEVLSGIKNEIAIDTEATGRNPLTDSLVGISICNEKERAFYIPVAHSSSPVSTADRS